MLEPQRGLSFGFHAGYIYIPLHLLEPCYSQCFLESAGLSGVTVEQREEVVGEVRGWSLSFWDQKG